MGNGGSAIFNSQVFTGNVTIEKLDVTSASGFGIGIGLLNNVLGTVTIHQVTAHDNTADGVFVVSHDA